MILRSVRSGVFLVGHPGSKPQGSGALSSEQIGTCSAADASKFASRYS